MALPQLLKTKILNAIEFGALPNLAGAPIEIMAS